MRKIIFIQIVFITSFCFSQNQLKKEIDFRKQNRIKEIISYQQNLKYPEQKTLWDWKFYDTEGLLIEEKIYSSRKTIQTHYKIKYPNTESRILISLDESEKEIERIKQKFEVSDEPEERPKTSANGKYAYEYDKNGNNTKVWIQEKKQKYLFIEVTFEQKNLRVKESIYLYNPDKSSYTLQTKTYERDKDGNVIKTISKLDDKISSIKLLEIIKYSM